MRSESPVKNGLPTPSVTGVTGSRGSPPRARVFKTILQARHTRHTPLFLPTRSELLGLVADVRSCGVLLVTSPDGSRKRAELR